MCHSFLFLTILINLKESYKKRSLEDLLNKPKNAPGSALGSLLSEVELSLEPVDLNSVFFCLKQLLHSQFLSCGLNPQTKR